jgi:serine/threonine protein kinase
MSLCLICQTSNSPGAAVCAACGSPLADAAPPRAGSTPGAPAADVLHALANGTRLQSDAFRVDGILGQGGFGITYRGHDLRLERPVAIKEFFPFGAAIRISQDNRLEPSGGLSRAEFDAARAAFFEEARTLARFSHPNIVNVFTAFEEKNTAYMVMEFLSGQSLQARIEERRALSEAEALDAIEQVGRALEVIHGAGLLHRDLKPDNILLCPDTGGTERAVLLDFGSARSFTAGQTQNLDRLLTPGYAPLEQYSSSARFDVYTDIYSLGATLYQCLTGQVPPAATDRAGGVQLVAPRQLNPQLSRAISDATLWALSLSATDRPQSMRAFLEALRASTAAPTASKSPRGSTPGANRRNNDPRAARIEAILQKLSQQPVLPASPYDADVKKIRERLAEIAALPAPRENDCPACRKPTLRHIAPAVGAARCPLCEGQLKHRRLDADRCPLCRAQALREYNFGEKKLFCPLCQAAPLREEHRKKLGFKIDLWLTCPHCKAEWDAFSDNTAKLMSPGSAPRGAEFLGQIKPLAQWKEMAGRSDKIVRCGNCEAQFDEVEGGRLKLVRAPQDPHGVAAQYMGKAFFRHAWTRLAHGLPLGAGNCVCEKCRAEWNYDAPRQTLRLLQCDETFAAWKNQTHGLSQWKFLRTGKSSGRAGSKCENCATEFDDDKGLLRLVSTPVDPNAIKNTIFTISHWVSTTPSALELHKGEKFSLLDWHRLAANLPTSREETNLRSELSRIEKKRGDETATQRKAQERDRQNLEHELDSLARQSFLNGFLESSDTSFSQSGEDVRWMSNAVLLKRRTRQNVPYWDTDRQGVLMVTSARLVFLDAPGSEHWARPLSKIKRVETPYIAGQPLLEVHVHGLKNPVGFIASEMPLDVIVAGKSRRLVFTSSDLASWLSSQK